MCYRNDYCFVALVAACFLQLGCIESPRNEKARPFAADDLESCLTVVLDMSGSFANKLDSEAYPLLLKICDEFFVEGNGTESRIVICQLSGDDQAVLYEGRPSDLQSSFQTPEELATFLRERSDSSSSQVYKATGKAVSFVTDMTRVSHETRLVTVIFSDMVDSQSSEPERTKDGKRMLSALNRYQELGGGLALYFVSVDETSRWKRILNRAGFQKGAYIIESELSASPQLPRFD